MVTLTIDGKEVTVPQGTTILEAARSVGIRIPTLCYHDRMNPIGSCRMCVVEIEGFAHPMAACTTPVEDGPICDKGGECLLQDLVYEFGIDEVEYQAAKIERDSMYATPLIRYWPDRCVMCLRCVTACREIKGIGAISIEGEGYGAQVVAIDPEKCQSCGECLQVCPTGALTADLTRYRGRTWLLERVPTTCTYCGCGCQLELNVQKGKVIAVTARDGVGVNQGSLCVKGRFGYEFINSEERLTTPLIKKNGTFQEATWDEALDLVAGKFSAIKEEFGPGAIGGLTSARCTNEENYLFQKFMRAVIGTNNVDHCARL